MKEKITKRLENQSGEVMLEAAMILLPILLLLLMLLSLSFFFYQQAMMTSVATEIAADAAKNYKFTSLDIGAGTLSLDNFGSADDDRPISMFRMTFGKGGLSRAHTARAEEYVDWRIPMATLGLHPGEVEVDCRIDGTGIGRAVVKATVSQRSDFFLSDLMAFLGFTEENTLFSAVSYAECVDPMAYTSSVNFANYLAGKLGMFDEAGRLYNSVGDLIDSVESFAEKLIDDFGG